MNIISVINWNGFWSPNAMLSVQNAANRWDAVLIERSIEDYVGAKLDWTWLQCPRGTRIMCVDADVVIRQDCPNPFELVDEKTFGGVANVQDQFASDEEAMEIHGINWRHVSRLFEYPDLEWKKNSFLNAGLFIWTSGVHDIIWKVAGSFWRKHPMKQNEFVLNVVLSINAVELTVLPRSYNRVGPAVWTSNVMYDYVHHFANHGKYRGDSDKRARISSLDWRT